MSAPVTMQFDIFISYSHADSAWVVQQLLPRLEAAGLRVCIDTRDFEIGVPSLVNMERAVDNSHHVLLVLTPAWLASEWTEFESLLAGSSDPAARRRKIIPLMLQPSSLPSRLAMLTWADFRDPNQHEVQFQRLVSQLQRIRGMTSLTPGTPPSRPSTADQPVVPPGSSSSANPIAGPTTVINTSGGAYIAGNVTTGGDFIGRDRITGASTTPGDDRQRDSWQRQLANYRNSLRLVEERMAEYVLSSDVPLQLIREKEQLLTKIQELEDKLGYG